MSGRAVFEFVLLAAVWGASFLCMRVAAPALGPIPVALLRCAIGALFLLSCLVAMHKTHVLRRHLAPSFLVGLVNSAIPFALLGYASLTLFSGTTSIINSLAPIWAAILAFLWFGDRLTHWQLMGLVFGVSGVAILAAATDAPTTSTAAPSVALAFTAAVAATTAYGLGANCARRYLHQADPMAVATGSQIGATLALLVPGIALWPETTPTAPNLWIAIAVLGLVCTGVAYLLFFRLIATIGATKTVAVTFLIPVFGVLWGALLLNEPVHVLTLVGAATIVAGTALTTFGKTRMKQS